MIDIEKLKLTEKEIRALHPRVPDYGTGGKAADAQLAKALWGLAEQWEHGELCSYNHGCDKCLMIAEFEAAGLPRPEKEIAEHP